MTRQPLFLVGVALLTMSAAPALADCASEITGLTARVGGTGKASKETAGGNQVAKDGSQMPLGESTDQAMSAQDVRSQQQGGRTAAEEAGVGKQPGAVSTTGGGTMAALDQARAAQKVGDEAGCMKAIEEVKASMNK